MSSQNLSLVERNSFDNSCEAISDKETQTSALYITDSFALLKGPSRPLPKGIDKSRVEPALNILDCRVIKDPSDSKTTDGVTDSFIKDIDNSDVSISEDGESSRLKYCKEVVTPYLKANFQDCKENIDSLEQLIQDALEEVPDYQPCSEVYEGTKDIQEKISITSAINMESLKATNFDELPIKSSSKNKDSEDNFTPTLSKPIIPDNSETLEDIVNTTGTENEKMKRNISKESVTKCVQDGVDALKCSASNYLNKLEVVIGIKKPENSDEKPKLERNASYNAQTETSNSLSSILDMFNNNNDTITTVKETVKDIAGKFYKTSKDAMTLISTESGKLLSKGKTNIFNTDNTKEAQPKPKEVNLKNSFASFLFKKAENKPIQNENSNNETDKSQTKLPDISPTAIKSHIIKIAEEIVESKIDKSSLYDKVVIEVSNEVPDTEKYANVAVDTKKSTEHSESRIPTVSAIDHTPEPQSSNMFTIIKSKFFSMFRDDNENIAEPVRDEINAQNDEEEDPFERFMEQ